MGKRSQGKQENNEDDTVCLCDSMKDNGVDRCDRYEGGSMFASTG